MCYSVLYIVSKLMGLQKKLFCSLGFALARVTQAGGLVSTTPPVFSLLPTAQMVTARRDQAPRGQAQTGFQARQTPVPVTFPGCATSGKWLGWRKSQLPGLPIRHRAGLALQGCYEGSPPVGTRGPASSRCWEKPLRSLQFSGLPLRRRTGCSFKVLCFSIFSYHPTWII